MTATVSDNAYHLGSLLHVNGQAQLADAAFRIAEAVLRMEEMIGDVIADERDTAAARADALAAPGSNVVPFPRHRARRAA